MSTPTRWELAGEDNRGYGRHFADLVAQGADLLDIGGESTRPGAIRPLVADELDRVVPVIRELAGDGAVVSVDTMRAEVAAAALDAGAAEGDAGRGEAAQLGPAGGRAHASPTSAGAMRPGNSPAPLAAAIPIDSIQASNSGAGRRLSAARR